MYKFSEGRRSNLWDMLLVPISLCVVSTSAWAADWRYEPRVDGTAGYGKNINLSREPESQNDTTQIYWFTIENDLVVESPSLKTTVGADARIRRYPHQKDLDSEGYRVDLATVKTTPRNEFTLDGWYTSDSTVITELEDTGQTQENRRRDEWALSPAWTRSLSQRTRLKLAYTFTDVSFEQGDFVSDLQDFQDQLFHAQLTRIISERMDLFAGARYLLFDSDDGLTKTDTAILSLGVDGELSERWTGDLEVGWRRVATEDFSDPLAPIDGSDDGIAYKGSLSWQSQRQSLTFSASLAPVPSASGTVSEEKFASVSYENQLTSKITFGISVSASDTDYDFSGESDRRYYSAETNLVWRIRPLWDAELSYRYDHQKFDRLETDPDDLADSADKQEALLTLRHRWNPVRFR